jgi:hypothetical protein
VFLLPPSVRPANSLIGMRQIRAWMKHLVRVISPGPWRTTGWLDMRTDALWRNSKHGHKSCSFAGAIRERPNNVFISLSVDIAFIYLKIWYSGKLF